MAGAAVDHPDVLMITAGGPAGPADLTPHTTAPCTRPQVEQTFDKSRAFPMVPGLGQAEVWVVAWKVVAWRRPPYSTELGTSALRRCDAGWPRCRPRELALDPRT